MCAWRNLGLFSMVMNVRARRALRHIQATHSATSGYTIEDEEVGDRSLTTAQSLENILTKHSANDGTDGGEFVFS